ncbi:MAG: hypothetical protein U1D30_07220 [Planctomycetota bacterium]
MESELRLRRLERRQWALLALIMLLVAVVGIDHWPRHDNRVVIARRLILIDPLGNERAALETEGNSARLRLADDLGNTRAILDAGSTGPGLTLLDSRGKVRVLLAAEKGGPYFGLTDEGGTDLFKAP